MNSVEGEVEVEPAADVVVRDDPERVGGEHPRVIRPVVRQIDLEAAAFTISVRSGRGDVVVGTFLAHGAFLAVQVVPVIVGIAGGAVECLETAPRRGVLAQQPAEVPFSESVGVVRRREELGEELEAQRRAAAAVVVIVAHVPRVSTRHHGAAGGRAHLVHLPPVWQAQCVGGGGRGA